MKLTGYRSPGRRATRDKLRAMAAPPVAKNCPEMFATDKEFIRLFRESKRVEHDRKQRDRFVRLRDELRARGFYLEHRARRDAELAADGVYVPELGLTVVADDGTPTVPLLEGLKTTYDPREMAKLAPKGWPSNG